MNSITVITMTEENTEKLSPDSIHKSNKNVI